jgi:Protein of unknown function (DUF1580)
MYDTVDDELLPLRRAGTDLPGSPGPGTVRSWADHGVRGVRLETFRVGGLRYTTRAALRRFLDAINGGATNKS